MELHLFRNLLLDPLDSLFDGNRGGARPLAFGAFGANGQIQVGGPEVVKGTGKGMSDEAGARKFFSRGFQEGGTGRVAIAAMDAVGQAKEKILIGDREGENAVLSVMIEEGLEPPGVAGKGFLDQMENET
jgi:hypothetical protein